MVTSLEISFFLKKEIKGKECVIDTYFSLSNIKCNSVVFAKKYNEQYVTLLNSCKGILAIVTPEYDRKLRGTYIISENPRLDYMKIVQKFFNREDLLLGIHPSAVIEEGASIGDNVLVGANCYIGKNVIIGSNTKIMPNVIIVGDVIVGKECYIKSGVVIGQPGFGFEKDENGIPVHFPHVGKVVIGDYVYIGANVAIDRATLESTVIENHVKIDNLVHIAHNVHIGEGSYIIACTILGGGVRIGKNCWIAPNVSIKQQLSVGDNALVGLGAVVLKDVDDNSTVVGNPAKVLNK